MDREHCLKQRVAGVAHVHLLPESAAVPCYAASVSEHRHIQAAARVSPRCLPLVAVNLAGQNGVDQQVQRVVAGQR